MRWTKLKQLIEARFAECLRGRLEVHVTRYRKSHDELNELWLTFDGQRIAAFSDGKSYAFIARRRQEIESEGRIAGATSDAFAEAYEHLPFASDLMDLMFSTLSMPLDDILRHKNMVVRALGIADARFGQRRVMAIDAELLSPIEKEVWDLREQSRPKKAIGSPIWSGTEVRP